MFFSWIFILSLDTSYNFFLMSSCLYQEFRNGETQDDDILLVCFYNFFLYFINYFLNLSKIYKQNKLEKIINILIIDHEYFILSQVNLINNFFFLNWSGENTPQPENFIDTHSGYLTNLHHTSKHVSEIRNKNKRSVTTT